MHLPLSGKNILVTREASQAKHFSEKILENGGRVHEVPLLTISCRNNKDNLETLGRLNQFDWIFFTSVNGVHCFFNLLEENLVTLPEVKFAVVGHKTEDALHRYGYQAEIVPTRYDGETLVSEFMMKYKEIGQVLLVQGNRSRDVIQKGLTEKRIPFQSIVVYETQYNEEAGTKLEQTLSTTLFDFITFTSPSTVEAFKRLSTVEVPMETTIVCIGNTTERRANELGYTNTISPEIYTVESMVEVMCNKIKEREENHGNQYRV